MSSVLHRLLHARKLRRAACSGALVAVGAATSQFCSAAGIDKQRSVAQDTLPATFRSTEVVRDATADEMGTMVTQALGNWLHTRVDRYELALLPAPATRDVMPKGRLGFRIRPLPAQGMPTPRMAVWVDVLIDGRYVRSMLRAVDVKAYQQAWVVRQDIEVGDPLNAQVLEHREVDVAAAALAAWQGQPEGHVARRRLLAGSYLTETAVTLPTAVARGQQVSLVNRLGGVEIVANALALQAGDPGQAVQVKVDAARTAVLARVVGPGKVELQQ